MHASLILSFVPSLARALAALHAEENPEIADAWALCFFWSRAKFPVKAACRLREWPFLSLIYLDSIGRHVQGCSIFTCVINKGNNPP